MTAFKVRSGEGLLYVIADLARFEMDGSLSLLQHRATEIAAYVFPPNSWTSVGFIRVAGRRSREMDAKV